MDSRGVVIWSTQPAVGKKEDYYGVHAWGHAATPQEADRAKLAWAHAMATGIPTTFEIATDPAIAKGVWRNELHRIDHSPIVACEWHAVVRNPLAPRELEIARLFAMDWKAGEIAGKLGISPHTVETVRQRILAKLGVRGVAGIVKWLLRARLIEI